MISCYTVIETVYVSQWNSAVVKQLVQLAYAVRPTPQPMPGQWRLSTSSIHLHPHRNSRLMVSTMPFTTHRTADSVTYFYERNHFQLQQNECCQQPNSLSFTRRSHKLCALLSTWGYIATIHQLYRLQFLTLHLIYYECRGIKWSRLLPR